RKRGLDLHPSGLLRPRCLPAYLPAGCRRAPSPRIPAGGPALPPLGLLRAPDRGAGAGPARPCVRALRAGRTRPPGDRPSAHRPGIPFRRQAPRGIAGPAARIAAGCVDDQRGSDRTALRRVAAAPVGPEGDAGMSWRIAIRHRTGYKYAEPVRASYNEARLTPPTVDGQRLLQAALAVTPAVRPFHYVDYWGTAVDSFDIHVPHTELVGSAVQDRFAEYLTASSYVTAEPELTELARSLRAESTPAQAGLRIAEWTHKKLRDRK